uniref:Glutaredoxin domain-containing protein n=1 Tax=Noctiluca scintillans TaxID=2966 RepID=A0A7S1EZQ9_NOCSC|mmetsp:Transcript_20100/g.53661  ORF Transcript_20100/g.53661 Transcript_20100/m.53661 type:complete len:122 (+) Transcript_20100:64-429(+)
MHVQLTCCVFVLLGFGHGNQLGKQYGSVDDVIASADVVFFDMPGCPYCADAERALNDKGIAFKKVNIAAYKPALREKTGKTSAPSVWIKGTYVGGCNDGTEPWHGVKPMLSNGKFEEMIRA